MQIFSYKFSVLKLALTAPKHQNAPILMQFSKNSPGETPRTPTCGKGWPPPPPSPFRRFVPQWKPSASDLGCSSSFQSCSRGNKFWHISQDLTVLCKMGNLDFGVLSYFSSMLNSIMKVIFLYLVANFSSFKIKFVIMAEKIIRRDHVQVVIPQLSVVRFWSSLQCWNCLVYKLFTHIYMIYIIHNSSKIRKPLSSLVRVKRLQNFLNV